jgi:hypothetical protein
MWLDPAASMSYTRLSVSLSAEAALGHVVAGVECDYRHRDALARRRQLMQQWADFIERPGSMAKTSSRSERRCSRNNAGGRFLRNGFSR